ncbi:Hypothetical predicted protein, partial [Marmota monax]
MREVKTEAGAHVGRICVPWRHVQGAHAPSIKALSSSMSLALMTGSSPQFSAGFVNARLLSSGVQPDEWKRSAQ